MSRNVAALSISFQMHGTPSRDGIVATNEIRNGTATIDDLVLSKSAAIESLTPVQKTRAVAVSLFARNLHSYFFSPALHGEVMMPLPDESTIKLETESQRLTLTGNKFTCQVGLYTELRDKSTAAKPFDGILKIEGNVDDKGGVTATVTILLTNRNAEEKKRAEDLLVRLIRFKHDITNQSNQTRFKVIKHKLFLIILPIATILTAGAVAPALIFFLLPLLSSIGLPFLALAGIGAAISLITLAVLFQAIAGIFLLRTNLQPSFPRITEDTIDSATFNAAATREGRTSSVTTPGVTDAAVAVPALVAAADTGVIDTAAARTDHSSGKAAGPVKAPDDGLVLRGFHQTHYPH